MHVHILVLYYNNIINSQLEHRTLTSLVPWLLHSDQSGHSIGGV